MTQLRRYLRSILAAARRYGFNLASNKLTLTRLFKFIGLHFNSVLMTVAISPEKIQEALDMLNTMLSAPQWERAEFYALCGVVFYFSRLLHALRGSSALRDHAAPCEIPAVGGTHPEVHMSALQRHYSIGEFYSFGGVQTSMPSRN